MATAITKEFVVQRLQSYGQSHIAAALGATPDTAGLTRLNTQLDILDTKYPGGINKYVENAKKLLSRSEEENNILKGYDVSVPQGAVVDVDTMPDTEGLRALGKTAFVLVAGGLGERLGFSGIKLALPVETATNVCYLQLYAEWIRAIEVENDKVGKLPLVIMTSDDTHTRTEETLREHNNFGMQPGQIILLKQEKVPAIADTEGRFATVAGDPYQIETKPHGHGDVHLVLRQAHLPKLWLEQGFEWVLFFQDTNAGTIFTATLSALFSTQRRFVMNSTSIPRKPKEAIGAITRLHDPKTTREIIINVEYNQLESCLEGGDAADPATGYSKYPGNINTFLLRLDRYSHILDATSGLMPEFVNPKYADAAKKTFKTPTRLECMMQDFPLLLEKDDPVGFTQFPRWCYTPVKNKTSDGSQKASMGLDPACAASGETEFYNSWCRVLFSLGVKITNPELYQTRSFLGVPVRVGPIVSLASSFAPCKDKLRQRIPNPGKVTITDRSSLVVRGRGVVIHSLQLDGALVIDAVDGASVIVESLQVKNDGWSLVPITSETDASIPEVIRMRGFTVAKHQTATYTFDKPGNYVIKEGLTSSL